METETIIEQPLFVLESSTWDAAGSLDVYASDLKKSQVGDKFIPYCNSNCGRACTDETLEVVFKNKFGVAVLYRKFGTTDSANPEEWSNSPKLLWVELH